MRIAGFVPNSMVDYPNNIAAVVFVGGCNFDCWYCHNRWLLGVKETKQAEEVLSKIEKNKNFLDGVVISGGEPTTEDIKELIDFITKIKQMGLLVKLDTNGTNFLALQTLYPLVDYVAMDIKAPLSKYNMITCISEEEILNLKKSINFLREKDNAEFRTTVVPTLEELDMIEIAYVLNGAKHYYLQQFVPLKDKPEIMAHPPKFLKEMTDKINKIMSGVCKIRGI